MVIIQKTALFCWSQTNSRAVSLISQFLLPIDFDPLPLYQYFDTDIQWPIDKFDAQDGVNAVENSESTQKLLNAQFDER